MDRSRRRANRQQARDVRERHEECGEPIRAEDPPVDLEEPGDLERVPPYMASGTGIEAPTIRH